MFKIIIFGTLLACANAYYNHGPSFSSNYYDNYGHVPAVPPVAPLYNHLTEVAPYVPKTVAQPIVNPFPTASRHGFNLNHLSHGYYHAAGATPAPTSSYIPPPVVVPPSVTYNNNNVVPPSVQNLNHAVPASTSAPVPTNYQHHAINYQQPPSYAPVYSHGHMYNHLNYGW